MASSADNSISLQVMAEANSDFLAFIQNLRAFLQGTDPVTFNVGSGITVNSLLKLINDYRNGVFNEIIIGGASSGTQIKLSVDSNGHLCVTDTAGNLAVIECDRISSSIIENCDVGNVTASGARIGSIAGAVSITGGNVQLKSLKIGNLTVTNFKANVMSAANLSVRGSLQCNGLLSYGTRKFVPNNVRNVFYRNGAPLNNASSLIKYTGTTWDMTSTPGSLVPADAGFQNGVTTPALSCAAVPGMVRILGDNKYDDFVYGFGGPTARGPAVNPDNIVVMIVGDTGALFAVSITRRIYELAALLAWPCGSYNLTLDNGYLNLMTFVPSDNGKEIYYETLSEPWKIYRVMRVTYNSGSAPAVEFAERVTLAPYSCTRFIARIHDSNVEQPSSTGPRVVVYSLEYA